MTIREGHGSIRATTLRVKTQSLFGQYVKEETVTEWPEFEDENEDDWGIGYDEHQRQAKKLAWAK